MTSPQSFPINSATALASSARSDSKAHFRREMRHMIINSRSALVISIFDTLDSLGSKTLQRAFAKHRHLKDRRTDASRLKFGTIVALDVNGTTDPEGV